MLKRFINRQFEWLRDYFRPLIHAGDQRRTHKIEDVADFLQPTFDIMGSHMMTPGNIQSGGFSIAINGSGASYQVVGSAYGATEYGKLLGVAYEYTQGSSALSTAVAPRVGYTDGARFFDIGAGGGHMDNSGDVSRGGFIGGQGLVCPPGMSWAVWVDDDTANGGQLTVVLHSVTLTVGEVMRL